LSKPCRRSPSCAPTLSQLVRSDPKEGSRAVADATVPFGPCALMYAGQSLQVAIDQLIAWHALFAVARHLPSFAHVTLLRTAIESAAKARWLVDMAEPSTERAFRGALCQLESTVELRRFVQTDPENEQLAKIRRRERALRKVMARHGYDPGRKINSTEIAESYGIGEWAWRFTSGFAHGQEWAITSGGHSEESPGVRKGQRRINASAKVNQVIDFTKLTVGLAINAHNEITAYMGGYSQPM
jgi:hypothetical protein